MAKKQTTTFALDGSLREFDGTLFQLRAQITAREWETVVKETIVYRTFVAALKKVGMPRLGEKWTKQEQAELRALDKTIASMRGMDALLVASVDTNALFEKYCERMEQGAQCVSELIKEISTNITTQITEAHETARHTTVVSGL